jgi:hypothetical protein
MKRTLLPLCLLLAVVPAGAQSMPAGVPTYLNAEIVRVDRAEGSATLRSESGDIVLTADAHAFAGLVGLRAGDKVVVAYETLVDEAGRSRRIVTYAQPASPTSGQPGPVAVVSTVPAVSFASTVRVLSVDRANQRITVTDTSGTPVLLRVTSRSAASLGGLNAGDVVGLNFTNGGVVTAEVLPSVSAIQVLPSGTAVGSYVLPPFNARFVRFDADRSLLTVETAGGRQRTFPVSGGVTSSLGRMRAGEGLSLNFQVIPGSARMPATVGQATLTGGATAVMSVSNVQTLPPGFVQRGPNTFATTGTVSSLATAPVAPAPVVTATLSQPAFVTPAPVVATGILNPASPYTQTVPSLPGPTTTLNPVLPPAAAREPLSEDEVGLMRSLAERDLDAAAVVLAGYANEIDAQWFRFKNLCMAGTVPPSSESREWFLLLDGRLLPPSDDQCRTMAMNIEGLGSGWEQQLGITLDAARRADLLPGRIRQTLSRHRIDR